jgi:DNA end-binding protein Ku
VSCRTLRFAHEVRKQAEYFSMIPEMKLTPEMVKLAQHIIETKFAAFNLMDALRRSIAAKPPAKRPAAASKAARAN